MRFYLLPTTLLLTLASALELPDSLPSSFFSAFQDSTTSNETAHDLFKRAGNCPNGFNSCSSLGAPQLCCASHAVCSADAANVVACCPSGAACTGVINGVVTQGTVNSDGVVVGGGAVAGATSSSYGGVVASPTTTTSFQYATATTTAGSVAGVTSTNSGFIVVGGSATVATPAAGVRRAEIPAFVQAIVHMVQYLPG